VAITIGTPAAVGGYAISGVSTSHTIGSGTNRLLLMFFTLQGATAYTPSNVKYNNVAMNLLGSVVCPALYSRSVAVFAYYLLEANLPAAGTYTANAQVNAGYSGGFYVIDLANCTQSAPSFVTGGNSNNPGFTTAFSTSITSTATTELVLDGSVIDAAAGGGTFGAGQTSLENGFNITGGAYMNGSHKFASGAGSQTMSYTPTSTPYTHWAQLITLITEYVTPAPPGRPSADNACFISGF
jgi:hypothetical protein